MKNILLFVFVNCTLIACCANNRQPKTDISVNIDSVQAIKTIPENIRNISAEIISEFNGWQIDSIKSIENSDEYTRFFVTGIAKENIDKRKMSVQLANSKTNNSKEVWSYVVLNNLTKDKPFKLEVLYFPNAGTVVAYSPVKDSLKKYNDKTDVILMSKQDMKLRMINFYENSTLSVPMATGKNAGDKKISGDKKTPDGIFTVYAIHDASGWDYDFKDGKGKIKGTYGKHFIRFKENYHIGIHGTHLPETVGLRATEGCVRLTNENIDRIVPMVARSKTLMIVTPAIEDYEVDN